jgi:hypothetical protein
LDSVGLRIPSRSIRDFSTSSVHRNFKASPSATCVSAAIQSVGTLTYLTKIAFYLCILVRLLLVIFFIFGFVFLIYDYNYLLFLLLYNY